MLITVDELLKLDADGVVIIDTRSSWKFFMGHIPNAVNLSDWRAFTRTVSGVKGVLNEDKKFILQSLRPLGIDKNTHIILYGDPADPWRTDGRFFWMFERYGFNSVSILEGGLTLWKEQGGPVERGGASSRKPSGLSEEDLRFNLDTVADSGWILERLESENLAIVDNRTREEYDGKTPYGSDRGGHIPKAIHIPWQNFFTESGLLKNPEVLTELLKKYGIQLEMEIVVYCTGGVRSAMAYFVFRVLGVPVRNYDGSWWDWSHNPDLPVEAG